jgi:hypothetical protein
MNLDFFSSHPLWAVILSLVAVIALLLSLYFLKIDRKCYVRYGGKSRNLFIGWLLRFVLGFAFVLVWVYNPPIYQYLSFWDFFGLGVIAIQFILFVSDIGKACRGRADEDDFYYGDLKAVEEDLHEYIRGSIAGQVAMFSTISIVCLFLVLYGDKLFG